MYGQRLLGLTCLGVSTATFTATALVATHDAMVAMESYLDIFYGLGGVPA